MVKNKEKKQIQPESGLFIKLPLVCLDHNPFISISAGARLALAVMRNRENLSKIHKQYLDEEKKVYIIYSEEQIASELKCTKHRAARLIEELEKNNLIRRPKPDKGIIYITPFNEIELKEKEKSKAVNSQSRSTKPGKNGRYPFVQIPRVFVEEGPYQDLPDVAKLLYADMRNRMQYEGNGLMTDEENNPCLRYSYAEMLENMHCSSQKLSKSLSKLEEMGLIRRVNSNGKAGVIYVTDILKADRKPENADEKAEEQNQSTSNMDENAESKHFGKDVEKCKKEVEVLPFSPVHIEKEGKNDSERSFSINQSFLTDGVMGEREIVVVQAVVAENLNLDAWLHGRPPGYVECFMELYNIICDELCSEKESYRILGARKPASMVKSILMKLRAEHLDYVIECMENRHAEITNMKGYLLSALYNAFHTMEHHSKQKLNHELDLEACDWMTPPEAEAGYGEGSWEEPGGNLWFDD